MISLRRASSAHGVSTLELFFDLVFVFAVTQLSHGLIAHPTLEGLLQTALLTLAVWWAWMYTTWATNWADPERFEVRVMLLVLMVTSKGIAGVPRASLVVVAAVLPMFNLPEAGVLLILGIDHFLDMGRTLTNVMGNAIATAVVAKWEKSLDVAQMQRELVNPTPRQVLLVDHAEQAQSVAGIEQAHIVEILDHHHIGSIETRFPVAAAVPQDPCPTAISMPSTAWL